MGNKQEETPEPPQLTRVTHRPKIEKTQSATVTQSNESIKQKEGSPLEATAINSGISDDWLWYVTILGLILLLIF